MRMGLADMFIKQSGSYGRMLAIIRMQYPNANNFKSQTLIMEGAPVLVITFEPYAADYKEFISDPKAVEAVAKADKGKPARRRKANGNDYTRS